MMLSKYLENVFENSKIT